ncbi:hypothetical protein [Bradyrhizobium vignae]|uniref:hypothetical protein n=1 Tax=Bradyrhizobium vignae TaxID=1549949 RepID=UPI003221B40E
MAVFAQNCTPDDFNGTAISTAMPLPVLAQDSSDRAGAEPTVYQVTEAIVDLRGRIQFDISRLDGASNIMIADGIAGADDHSNCAFWHSGSWEHPGCGMRRPRQAVRLKE